MRAAPPQKLPSSCNDSSIDNVKEGSFCPSFKGLEGSQLETNARNHLEPCNCQGQGETLSSTPWSGELTRPRLQSQSMANHWQTTDTGTPQQQQRAAQLGALHTRGGLVPSTLHTPDLHILVQAPAPGCCPRPSPTPLTTPCPTLSSWGPVTPLEILWLLCLLHIQPATRSSLWPVSGGPRKLRMVVIFLKSHLKKETEIYKCSSCNVR